MTAITSILLYEKIIITVRSLTRGCYSLSSGRAFQHWHSVPLASGGSGSVRTGICGTAECLRGAAAGLRPGTPGGGGPARA